MSQPNELSPLTIQLFGRFQAQRGGTALPGLHLREGERLLAYLTLRAGESVTARELAKCFWPAEARMNADGEGNYPSVRQALHALRQALGPESSRLNRPYRAAVQFDLSGIEVDMLSFDQLTLAEGETAWQSWEAAIALYRGPLLEGWRDAWVVEGRARRHRAYERALRRLIQHARQQGDDTALERWMRLLLAAAPEEEETARSLSRFLSGMSRYLEASELLEQVVDVLKREGRTPEPETHALMLEVRKTREQAPAASGVSATSAALIATVPTVSASDQRPQQTASFRPAVPAPHTAADSEEADFAPEFESLALEPTGGAVPIDSRFYVARNVDREFQTALDRHDSIVLVKGARQVGKTSLLARGAQQARQAGIRVALTDFQMFNETQLATPDALCLALATTLAVQLELNVAPRQVWDPDFGPNMNLQVFLRRYVLQALPEPLVWGLDEVDRLFGCPFAGEIFGLFRSWHNARSLDPCGPWSRLTLVIAYATEAYLFITDLNQSPFNVGTRLTLEDFTLEQVAELNGKYGAPLAPEEVVRFHALTGGQPYLTRRGLDAVAGQGLSLSRLEAEADQEEGLFGDHLRRLQIALSRSPDLVEVVRGMLGGQPCPTSSAFHRLRTAGVLSGAASQEARFRCRLYASFLKRCLG